MPITLPIKDRRVKILRVMVNEAEYKALKQGQKKAKFKSLADYIRSTALKQNNA